MEQKLKEIVAEYIDVPVNEITETTIIDRSKVSSSIVLHRMYAKLAENGFNIDYYWDIKTFGNLLQHNNPGIKEINDQLNTDVKGTDIDMGLSIGIDIEEISAFPVAEDFREHPFYKMNFGASEISHCILQQNPYASFAGLFVAKEAIVKASSNYKNKPFNTIVIEHLPNGKPVHKKFQLAISHTKDLAICVAILFNENTVMNNAVIVTQQPESSKKKFDVAFWLSLISILVSITAIVIILKR